jgi:hypothetical protein
MPIIRLSKKQIDAAIKAREAALRKHPDLRLHVEQRQRVITEAVPSSRHEKLS